MNASLVVMRLSILPGEFDGESIIAIDRKEGI